MKGQGTGSKPQSRNSRIIDARVHVYALLDVMSPEGVSMRRFYPLQLERDHSPVFAMSWLVMHFLDGDSPLAPLAHGDQAEFMSLVVTVMGIESTTMQTVYGQYYYVPETVERGRRLRAGPLSSTDYSVTKPASMAAAV